MSSLAKPKDGEGSLMSQLSAAFVTANVVKPNQGRVVRQITFFGLWLLYGLAGWLVAGWILEWLSGYFQITEAVRYAAVALVSLLSFWTAYRSVNIMSFADFLIGVEAEMRKVTWPTRTELISGSSVVLFVVVSLAALMFSFDMIWTAVFTALRVR